ncbi:MAG: hypothetical protein U5K43_14845 [Halofilum sp. (in: g-proteobacteria)]|nr:hypothetical protein [Halofilum sp. (in: g-proteobacteria)]
MQTPLRRGKLHMQVELGDDEGTSDLVAAHNFRVDTTQRDAIWLVFDTEASLRTSHRQGPMHRQAHRWADAPERLARIEMPGLAEDLADIDETTPGHAAWHLRVEMGDRGQHDYRVQPEFVTGRVIFHVLGT